jgi:hypothetical protein
MNESTTDIRIVPLPTCQDVLTEVLRDGARRMLAQAVEAEAAAWIAPCPPQGRGRAQADGPQ